LGYELRWYRGISSVLYEDGVFYLLIFIIRNHSPKIRRKKAIKPFEINTRKRNEIGGINMLLQIIIGLMLVGVGGIMVYLARFLVNTLLPKFANEKGIMTFKFIGFFIVVAGAFLVFFTRT